jgi:DNA-binding LacI/PurR family transcriptional regulator
LTHKRADGLILLSPPPLPDSLWETNPHLPIVVVDGNVSHLYPSVVVDDVYGGELATRYLIQKGHRKLGFIGDELENAFGFVATQRRFEGFKRSLEQADLPLRLEWCRFGEHGTAVAYELAKALLSSQDRPSALFASSDVEAFGVLSAAFELGLRVPDDIAVIGFDDIESARYLNLTTVRQPLQESGRLGAEELLTSLADKQAAPAREILLPLEIIERLTV